MRFGQLSRARVRKEFVCQGCDETIVLGELAWGMRYYRKDGKMSWTVHIHIDCLVDYCDENERRREQLRAERVTDRAGRPKLEISNEARAIRTKERTYINFAKERLLWAYEDKTRSHIISAKHRLARHLRYLIEHQDELGPFTDFKLNFTRRDKQDAFLAVFTRREPAEIINMFRAAYGDPSYIANVLTIEGGPRAAEYGYTGQEWYE